MRALNPDQAEDNKELAMEYFKVAMEILAEELLVAKLEGKPVMENLKVVDRLIKVAGLRLRERKDNREQARFEWEQTKAEGGKRESGNEGGRKIQNPEAKIQENGRNEAEGTSKESKVRSQEPEKKQDNEVGLVELVPPIAGEKGKSAIMDVQGEKPVAEPPKDRESRRVEERVDGLIAGPSAQHPQGVRECPASGCAQDVLTGQWLTAQTVG